MNILVFSWRDIKHPLAGGAEQVDHEHHKGWVNAGHSVTLFSSHSPGTKSMEKIDGVNVVRKGGQILGVHLNACLWYLFSKHEDFDLVVDEFHGWPFFTPFYIRKPKMAVIQELTKEVWFKYPLPFYLNYFFGAIGYLLEPLFFLPYRNVMFMTGSKSTKEELKTVGIVEKKVTIVHHGVIIDGFTTRVSKEKKRTIIFLGALAKDKGIEDAITTFGILNKTGDYQFWVVGKGDVDYMKYLKIMARGVGLRKNVTFFGFVTLKKKFQLLQRAHLLINPSIREGWGLVNIEANVCGTPVIAYNSPGLTDSVKNEKSGIIVKANTPEKVASVIDSVMADREIYSRLKKGALSWSKRFSWDESRRESLKLITSLVK